MGNETIVSPDLLQCRICNSSNVFKLMDFGMQPNTFRLLSHNDEEFDNHDLSLGYCEYCGFVFILDPFPTDAFYNNYNWPTSNFPPPHCEKMCDKVMEEFLHHHDDFILDIGSNDGYLLKILRNRGYENILGIEPSKDCSSKAINSGIRTWNTYFDEETVRKIKLNYGTPKVIFNCQVLEHVIDIRSFTKNIADLMAPDTTLIIEVPDFGLISQRGDFTSIWEQHVNYFSINTLSQLLNMNGLLIKEYISLPYSGGSLLLFIQLIKIKNHFVAELDLAFNFRDKANKNITVLNDFLKNIVRQKKRVAMYGAGAKGSCMINLSGAKMFIDYVVDDNEGKIGKFMPGSRLPICSTDKLYTDLPDYCLISPFNAKDNEYKVMQKHSGYLKKGGKFIELFSGGINDSQILNI